MAAGLAQHNIRVNAICPSFVNTEGQAEWMQNEQSCNQIQSLHLFPVPEPEEVVPLALFLCSNESRSITGSIHQVDAGFTAFKSAQVDVMKAMNPDN